MNEWAFDGRIAATRFETGGAKQKINTSEFGTQKGLCAQVAARRAG
jgi:hypothetical protein